MFELSHSQRVKMNRDNWNLNPMANYAGLPCEQTISVGRWNVPPYDDQFHNFHAASWAKLQQWRDFPFVTPVSIRRSRSGRTSAATRTTSAFAKQRKGEIELRQMDQRRTEFFCFSARDKIE